VRKTQQQQYDPKHALGHQTGSAWRKGKTGVIGALALALILAAPATAQAAGTHQAALTRLAASGNIAAGKTVAFSGHYKGTVSLLIDNGSVQISSVKGTGTGTLVGSSSVAGSGKASASAQCDPFTGTGSIGGKAAKIFFKVTQSKSTGCSTGESGPVTVTFNGVAVATGGTGAARGASGSLAFKGTLKLAGTSGSQNGPYTVSLSGKLAVKG
jgi:hypothetical protein